MDADLVAIQMKLFGGKQVAAESRAVAKSVDDVGKAADSTAARGNAMRQQLQRQATAMRTVGMGMTKYLTVPIGGIAIASGALAYTFDRDMRNVNSIAQLPERQFRRLKQSVLELAGPTAQAPSKLAEGMYDLVSSGFDSRESLAIVEKAAYAASAGLTTTEISTKAVAAVLNAYRLPASAAGRVSDQLFETVNRGVISFEDLALQIGDVLPFAAQLNVGLHEVGAAVSTMTKAGLTPSETMTRIKSVLVTLLKPGKDLKDVLDDLGMSGEQLIKRKGLQGALELLTRGRTKEGIAALFPNVRALGGALALTGISAGIANEDLAAFLDTSGATKRALAEQEKSFSFQVRRAWSETQAVLIELGEQVLPIVVPPLVKVLRVGKDLVGWFANLPSPIRNVGLALGVLAAAAGPLLILIGRIVQLRVQLAALRAMEAAPGGAGGGLLGGFGKKAMLRFGAGAAGLAASQAAGSAVGGDLGNWISMTGSGAATGAMVAGVPGALVGGAIGGTVAAVQKLTRSERQLTVVQAKLARNAKVISEGMREQRRAGTGLAASEQDVRRQQRRRERASAAVKEAQRRLNRAIEAYGPGARQVISAEMRLVRLQRRRERGIERLKDAQRKHGIEAQQYRQIAQMNVLNERNEINVLSAKKRKLDQAWTSAMKNGASNERLNELARRGATITGRLREAQGKLSETLLDASQKIGPKYARFLKSSSREMLEWGGVMQKNRDIANGLAGALNRVGEAPVIPAGPGRVPRQRGPRGRGGNRVPQINSPDGDGGRTRYLLPVSFKVGRRDLLKVQAETAEDEGARS